MLRLVLPDPGRLWMGAASPALLTSAPAQPPTRPCAEPCWGAMQTTGGLRFH